MRLRTIFPKTAARRRKYWISAECLLPAIWPAASMNAATAFNRLARASRLLGSQTAVAQASSATFAINMISGAIVSVPPQKARRAISFLPPSLCIGPTGYRSPSRCIEFIQCRRSRCGRWFYEWHLFHILPRRGLLGHIIVHRTNASLLLCYVDHQSGNRRQFSLFTGGHGNSPAFCG
jgi:hypothetical protein